MQTTALVRAMGLMVVAAAGCARTQPPQETRYTIVRGPEQTAEQGGIPPDKEAEIRLVLQQREVSTRKCYQDVLTEKQDRNFAGTVKLLITVGTEGQAEEVKPAGGTLGSPEVESCLADTIKGFEFPTLVHAGDVQYEYTFRPAY